MNLRKHFNRRRLLALTRVAGTALLVGCLPKRASFTNGAQASTATQPICTVRPQQTEGPYFVDEKLNRSDIRSNPADGSVRDGVPLQLTLRVSQVSGDRCQPLVGAIVDIWHCDASGVYSDVNDRSSSTVGQKFLRGYQVTDTAGTVQFLTIYPGWYPGRTVHIHFKVRADSTSTYHEFTSQLYFDDAITDRVHSQAAYASRGQRSQRNDRDGIFQQGGDQLLLSPTETSAGYAASFDLGLEIV